MTRLVPEPEILSRYDTEHGNWEVDPCRPVRGEPTTNIVERTMTVPVDDSERSRVIRAHEMMHAKVSPAGDFIGWINRGIASQTAMKAVEEVRVNLLCDKVGFKVREHLTDGGETADGERLAATNDWANAVFMAVATAGTASSKPFLTGIRRHNRLWGSALLDISKRVLKEMNKAYKTGTLSSTSLGRHSGLSPQGFTHVERIAEWIDRLANAPAPQETVEEAEDGTGDGEGDGRKEGGARSHSNIGITGAGDDRGVPLTAITPSQQTTVPPHWGELVIGKLPLTVSMKGTLGKKRIAAPTGRSPRRLHRYYTDPQRRIFDKTVRGMGGIVVIDASGSMSFTRDQIKKIMENAPGCTVLSYSDAMTEENAYILADNGMIAAELPSQGYGNGVDFPAIEWAVKRKPRSSTPVVWVTDGGVCGPNQGYNDMLAMQCIEYCKKHNIFVVPHVNEAIKLLHDIKMGRKPHTVWPAQFRQTYRNLNGGLLR